jgi:ABC-type lipoprotein release transport system permease subunit
MPYNVVEVFLGAKQRKEIIQFITFFIILYVFLLLCVFIVMYFLLCNMFFC